MRNLVSNFQEKLSAEKPGWLLTLLVLILAAIPRLTSINAFIAQDETRYWEWSREFFLPLVRGDWGGTLVGPGNPSVTIFLNHSLVMGLKYGWAWLNGVSATALATWPDFQFQAPYDLLIERRWPSVIINTLAVVIGYRWLHRLFGGRIALLAAVLLAFDPFYLGDARTSRGEGLMTSFGLLAVLAFLLFWTSNKHRYMLFSGIAVGLALLTKTSAVSLIGWAGLATLVLISARPGGWSWVHLRQTVLALALWGAAIAATYWLLWPAMWVRPLDTLAFVYDFVANVGVSGRDNYYFGRLYEKEALFSYYFVVFILRITPVVLIGLGAGLVYLVRSRFWQGGLDLTVPAKKEPLLTALILGYGLVYGAMMTVGTLKRDHYLIPAFPMFDIVAAVGLVWLLTVLLARRSATRTRPLTPAVWSGYLALILLLQGATALSTHPYYYTYWNPLVLGHRWVASTVSLMYHLDLSAGAQYLNNKPAAENLKVAAHTTRAFEQIFDGETVRWVPEEPWIQADYLVVRQYHLQRQKVYPYLLNYFSHLELEHVVNIDGVDYLWIYQGPRAQYFAGPSTLGKASLLGYNLDQPPVAASQTVSLKLFWHNHGMTADDYLFWQLVDAGGYVWAEAAATPSPEFEEAARTPDQIVESQVALAVPPGTPPGTYFLRGGIYSRMRQDSLGYFTLPAAGDQVTVTRPATPPSIPGLAMNKSLDQPLTPELTLLGYDLADNSLVLNDENWLVLYWQARTGGMKDYVVSLQLLTAAGEEVAFWLGRPVFSGYPTGEWQTGEVVRDPWLLDLPPDLPPGEYSLKATLFEAEAETEVAGVTLTEVAVVPRRQRFEIPPMESRVDAQLGEAVTLLGYDLLNEPITGGVRLTINLYWQARQPVPEDYTIFVQVLDPAGHVVGQHDGQPADGTLPTSAWATGEIVADRHQVEFATLQPGEYRLIVGMYQPETGARLPVTAADGTDHGDYWQLYSFTVAPDS